MRVQKTFFGLPRSSGTFPSAGIKQLIYQITILISVNNSFNVMPKLSRDDCHSLELRIQTGIKKIISEFMEELETRTTGHEEPAPAREPGRPPASAHGGTTPAPAKPERLRKAKKTGINKLFDHVSGTPPTRRGASLESDMKKIFRKKHRRGPD
jgi:hypothetical protein